MVWLDKGKRSIDVGLMQVNWRYHQARLRISVAGTRSIFQSECRCGDSAGLLHHPAGLVGQRGVLPLTDQSTTGRAIPSPGFLTLAADRECGIAPMDRFNRQRRRMMATACLLVPVVALAELTVIYDSGNTQPIAPFLEVFESANEIPRQSPVPIEPKLGAADPKTWLPIQSPGLKPGPVPGKIA